MIWFCKIFLLVWWIVTLWQSLIISTKAHLLIVNFLLVNCVLVWQALIIILSHYENGDINIWKKRILELDSLRIYSKPRLFVTFPWCISRNLDIKFSQILNIDSNRLIRILNNSVQFFIKKISSVKVDDK